MSTRRIAIVLVSVVTLLPATVAKAASDVWDGNGTSPPNGIWGTGVNWVDNSTPGNGDTALFNIANTYNVTFNATPAAIQALTTSAGNVTFASSGGSQILTVDSASGGQDVTVNGGAILSLGTSGNPLHLAVGDDLIVSGGGTLSINFGSQVNTLDLLLGNLASPTSSTTVVDGTGSTLNRTGTVAFSIGNQSATLSYRNNASGDINGAFSVLAAPLIATANLNVESGADLELDSLTIGDGVNTVATGTVTVTGGGSTITQTGASTLTVGRATGNIGILNVNSSGVFTTGTGALAVNTTGTINIGGGTMHANGNLTMASGSTLTLNGGTLNANTGFNKSLFSTVNFHHGELVANGGSFTWQDPVNLTLNGQSATDLPHLRLTNGVTGSANSWLLVGYTNTAKLTIEEGSHLDILNSFGTLIGDQAASNGEIRVSGAGSTWTHSGGGPITVGNLGTGKLSISDGASVTSSGATISNTSSGDGAVDVTGVGSLWTNNGGLVVGNLGEGQLEITNGGVVTTSSAVLGFDIGGDGTVTVNGVGSQFTSGSLAIGNADAFGSKGAGRLRIQDGGKVSAGYLFINGGGIVELAGGTLRFDGYARAGYVSFGSGTIQVAGERYITIPANVVPTDYAIQDLFDDGAGGTFIGFDEGLTVEGSLNVWSPNVVVGHGRLSCFASVRVGDNNGGPDYAGELTIVNEGLLDAEDLDIRNNGIVTLNGGTIRSEFYFRSPSGTFNFLAGTIQIANDAFLGFNNLIRDSFGPYAIITHDMNLTVEGTATLTTLTTVDGGVLTVGKLANPQLAPLLQLQRGTLNVTNQVLTIGPVGPLGNTLDVNDDMTVNVTLGITNQGLVTGDGEIGGPFMNNATGVLRGDPGKSLTLTGADNVNIGRINLLGGGIEFTQNLTNNVGGLISGNGSMVTGAGLVNQGTMNFAGTANILGDVTNAVGGKIISGGGGATIFYDDVINNGEVRTSTNGFTVFFGSVSGSGTFTGAGTVNFEGDLTPGNSPASVSFGGSVGLGPKSNVGIEIGGLTAGSQYDRLVVNGTLSLDGSLNVSLINGFTPGLGNHFTVLTFGSRSGDFTSYSGLNVGNHLALRRSFTPTSLLLTARPTLDGDINLDGTVDIFDINDVSAHWSQSGPAGDANGDSAVDIFDINLISSNWGATGGATAVPEPSTSVLITMSLVGLVALGWRRRS